MLQIVIQRAAAARRLLIEKSAPEFMGFVVSVTYDSAGTATALAIATSGAPSFEVLGAISPVAQIKFTGAANAAVAVSGKIVFTEANS